MYVEIVFCSVILTILSKNKNDNKMIIYNVLESAMENFILKSIAIT